MGTQATKISHQESLTGPPNIGRSIGDLAGAAKTSIVIVVVVDSVVVVVVVVVVK